MIMYTDKHKIPFQIDEEDHESVSRYSWYMSHGYPTTNLRSYNPLGHHWDGSNWYGRIPAYLHIFLNGRAPEEREWDHKNRDRLDNRRDNFRIVTKLGNRRNHNPRIENISGYPGIHYVVNSLFSGYCAFITAGKLRLNLGRFLTFEEAVSARKIAEDKYWGTER